MRELYNLDQVVKKDLGEETKTWEEYWNHMLKDGIWADNWFVQAAALFLKMDFWIMDTTCTKKKPYFQVDGNLEDDEYCNETLYLGLAHEAHYQSLLLVDEIEENEKEKINKDEAKWNDEDTEMDEENEEMISETSQEEEMSNSEKEIAIKECPICRKQLKNVLLHIRKTKICKSKISDKKLHELEMQSKRIKKEKDKINLKRFKEKLQKSSQLQIRQNEWQRKCRTEKRNQDQVAYKERDRLYQVKHRRIGTGSKNRLNRFREDIMYGPLFICICCHGKLFRHSVKDFTDQLKKQIDMKIPIASVIADMNVVTRVITEYPNNPWSTANKKKTDIGTKYICTYCVGYLRCGKMPPTCVMNCLQLHDSDAQLKAQDLWLTELEASLISMNLIFHKIFTLPRSRWT